MKNLFIFMFQASIVAILTTLLTAECYLYYKQEVEVKPTLDCPKEITPTTETVIYNTNNTLEKELVCVEGFLHRVMSDNSFLLFDEEGEPVKCARKGHPVDLDYYQLYSVKYTDR